mmetsp:Transcript_34137/g.45129  ORF Transcript_34137/g.45129 Transcript_34137/m.45129 type:complete len:718 (+) Transcript_34137:193-2346(+)
MDSPARKWAALGFLCLLGSAEALNVHNNIQSVKTFIPSIPLGSKTSQALHNTVSSAPMQMNMKSIKTAAATLFAATAVFGGNLNAAVADVEPVSSPPAMMTGAPKTIRYSEFLRMIEQDRIEKVTFSPDGERVLAVDTDGERVKLDALPADPDLTNLLAIHKVDVTVLSQQNQAQNSGGGGGLFGLLAPGLLLTALFFLFQRGGQGGGGFGGGGMNDPMGMMNNNKKVQINPDTGVTFDDVSGCDAAKRELVEVVDFLKKPEKYTDLGARIPRGVIMEGPPGTGKTLLAKSVAGEAGVPFISCAGSEFVEMFVGVGAGRVRNLFDEAKKNAPCIIFIDEIDAVGRSRGSGQGGGNDEREQTLNQILVEMDGFTGNPGIIVLAATNRVDILDSALLRPGRFDRKVTVDLPDFNGRVAILKVHARGKPLASDVDLEAIARRCPGFSGASLQNLLNEAAIFAAREEREVIMWDDVDRALDRIIVGLEKKGASEQPLNRKELVAFHEAGHAVVGAMIPDYDMVSKITIVPRTNGAGGLTFFSPNELRLESGLYSRQYLEAQLAVALGGRLAEELVYGADFVTTGASNDLQQVANIAKRMITEWGMSEKLGPLAITSSGSGDGDGWGPEVLQIVDQEVERVVNNAYALAKDLVYKNKDLLYELADRLCEQETVSAQEFAMMIAGMGDNVYMAPYNVFDRATQKDEVLPYREAELADATKAPK